MTLPCVVKFQLEQRVQELAVRIIGVHSVRLIEGNEVSVIFDVYPDESESGLHYHFPLPETVNPADLPEFAMWLSCSRFGDETLH